MRVSSLVCTFIAAVALAGCESNDTGFEVLLSTDTVDLAAPTANSTLPSALDITNFGTGIEPGRRPERAADAEEWDVTVRLTNGELRLVPGSAIGVSDLGGVSRSAVTGALAGKTLATTRQAPNAGSFVTDSGVVLRAGSVYVIRSRLVSCGFSPLEKYAKVQPLAVNVAAQTVKLEVVANERCADQRLAEED